MNFNFTLFNKRIGLSAYARDVRHKYVSGYCNRTIDGLYIITLDYDDMDLDTVQGELNRLQEDHALGDFYIFKSGGGYHGVCLDKVNFKELLLIMENSSIDINYMKVPLYSGKKLWVLRLTDKDNKSIEYVCKIPSSYESNVQSTAHANLLNTAFGLDIIL